MSERSHKRKRTLEDSTVDLSKMAMALMRLEAVKEDLDGIEETEGLLGIIFDHVLTLESILRSAKKPRVSFSNVTLEDLKKAGVTRRALVFANAKITELTKRLTVNAEAEITDLYSRIKKIFACVNMDYEPASRMILDAILLALVEIISIQQRSIAILPEMRITDGDGVQISHPTTGYELWLNGSVDYAIIEYKDVEENKARLLASGGAREDVFEIANGRLFLVEAKRQSLERSLRSYVPEAVSQAIALLKSANLPEVRFCLSDGQRWIFFILKSENGSLTYYESVLRHLNVENSDLSLREIVQLICEWLKPTMTDLFVLK